MDLKKIIFDSPLYAKWEKNVDIEDENRVVNNYTLDHLISRFKDRVEHYCTECETMRVFAPDLGIYDARSVSNSHYGGTTIKNKPSLFKTFRCSADSKHQILFSFLVNGEELIKVAEYPSKYDTVINNFNSYKKILSKNKLKELGKASQLESYGYAIASFLYYRRIFEDIILQTFKESELKENQSEEEFRKLRMEDKIKSIKEYLPDYFNENSHIYGILSKGVHELEEEECNEYLPVVKAVIFYSLDEAVDKRNKELRKIELTKKLQEINSKMK